MSEKATFYARDPGETSALVRETAGVKEYIGAERRRMNRRTNEDRRGEIRFDLTKEDRRQNQGRREADYVPDYW